MTMDGLNVVCVQVQLDQSAASFLDGGGPVGLPGAEEFQDATEQDANVRRRWQEWEQM